MQIILISARELAVARQNFVRAAQYLPHRISHQSVYMREFCVFSRGTEWWLMSIDHG